jgi:uncharacterized cupredoxin-like copper-binding protein
MRTRSVVVVLGAAVVAVAAFVGCQGIAPSATATGGASSVRVAMDEFSLKPSVASVPAGKITFDAVNQGKLMHEFVVLKTDLPPKGLKMDSTGADKADEDASGTNVGEIGDIEAGTSKTDVFDLVAGHYLLVCNEVGHYHQGMVTPFEVR